MNSTAANRDTVHEALWAASDKRGKVVLVQRDLAREIGLSVFIVCRVVGDLEDEGRIKKIATRYRNAGVYVIRDPDEFDG